MSIAQSMLSLAEEELSGKNCSHLVLVRVEYGALAGVEPQSLQFCFEALTKGTVHEGARLELVRLPLRLRCPLCLGSFGGEGQEALWQACPHCGEQVGHVVEQGKELILSHLEAE